MDSQTSGPRPRTFLDAFLDERNIRWLLGIGVLLLLGSSLMIVASHWHETTPLWKTLTIVGYTAAAYGAGRWVYERLGLRRTGSVGMALPLLLIPVDFYALRWVAAPGDLASAGMPIALFAFTGVVSAVLARASFRRFLCDDQWTLVASYLVLAGAGGALPWLDKGGALLATGALWLVLWAGIAKSSRHTFWLTEEKRRPRISGFAPLALLGTQFAVLVGTLLAPSLPTESWSVAGILVAFPIQSAALAVLDVYRQRSGGLVRRLPSSVALPMLASVGLAVAGVAAAFGFVASGDADWHAVTPSALFATVILYRAARSLDRRTIALLAVATCTVGYFFSPAFFREWAQTQVMAVANVIGEDRMPAAYYGLTFLPLLGLFTLAATWLERRGDRAFPPVLRGTVTLASVALLALGWGHAKAAGPVGAALGTLLGSIGWIRRDRTSVALAGAAWVQAFAGASWWASEVWTSLSPYTFLMVGSIAFLACGGSIDRRLRRWPDARRVTWLDLVGIGDAPMLSFGTLLTLSSSVIWLTQIDAFHWTVSNDAHLAVWTTLLAVFAFRQTSPFVAAVALGLPAATTIVRVVVTGASVVPSLATLTIGLVLLDGIGRALTRRGDGRLARTFAPPSFAISTVGLSSLALVVWLPSSVLALLDGSLATELGTTATLPNLARASLVLWGFGTAHRRAQIHWSCGATLLGFFFVLSHAAVAVGDTAWLPAIAVGTAWAAIPVFVGLGGTIERSRRSSDRLRERRWNAVLAPVAAGASLVLGSIAVSSLFFTADPHRVAGVAAIGGLIALHALDAPARPGAVVWPVLNAHLFLFIARLAAPGANDVFSLLSPDGASAGLPIAITASVELAALNAWRRARHSTRLPSVYGIALQVVTLLGLGVTLLHGPELSGPALASAVGCLAVLAWSEARCALRKQRTSRAWTSILLVGAAVALLARYGVISFGGGRSPLILSSLSCLAYALARRLTRPEGASETPAVAFRDPLRHVALFGVWTAAGLALLRAPTAQDHALLLGTLGQLGAAAVLFWMGLAERRVRLLVSSLAIANFGLACLWTLAEWNDLQLYLVPIGASLIALPRLLSRELPKHWHDPLYYAGALTILVSPVPAIVGGDWLAIGLLMVSSVVVMVLAMGLRVRSLLYTGAAFLAIAVVTMILRTGVDHPDALWFIGLGLGALTIGLAAYFEGHRERLVTRMRALGAALDTWR